MLPNPKHLALCFALFGLVIDPARANAQPAAPPRDVAAKATPTKFLRIQRDAVDEPTALETAVVRYVPATGDSGLTVDLVGVVHVGDKTYYEKLNKLFEQYDVVLYELVAPRGTRPAKGGRREGGNPVALLQEIMKGVLDLDSQMEHIDYTKKNFVHADLSFEEMAKVMSERGEDGLTLALGVAADLLRQQNLLKQKPVKAPKGRQPETPEDLLNLLFDPAGPAKLKRLLAQQFEDMGNPAGGLGPTLSALLIDDRNGTAMKVFQKELAKGKKKIAIFYGAAHMPDFEKRLQNDFGLKRQGEKWLIAWDLQPRSRNFENLLRELLK